LKIICKKWSKKEGFHAFVLEGQACNTYYMYIYRVEIASRLMPSIVGKL
jgi:hypothetical protein